MGSLEARVEILSQVHLWRRERGLTQQHLADAVGVTRATIVALEKGNYNPSLELAFRLAKFFKTDIHSLFRIEG